MTQIATEVDRIKLAKETIRTAIIGKGVNVPTTVAIDRYGTYIDAINTAQNNIYSGSSEPSNTLGNDGDIYIKI